MPRLHAKLYLDHGYNSDEGRWTGVQLLHNSEGSFHAAWVGPFFEDNRRYGQEWTVRTLLNQRGLNEHARIFCADFPEAEEAWDWTFETDPEEDAGGETDDD